MLSTYTIKWHNICHGKLIKIHCVQKNYRTHIHWYTSRCIKLLRLTFSSDQRKACWKTGESLSPNFQKLFCFWEILFLYVLFMQGQFLCQWPLPPVEIVLCNSEWHVYCSSLSHPFVFSCSLFLFSFTSTVMVISFATEPSFLCNFHFLMWLLLLMPHPLTGPFIFKDIVYHYQLVDPGQVLYEGLILPCRSFRPSPWCCVEWLSAYLVRWLSSIGITSLQKLICVIKVVQCLLFFPGWPVWYWVWLTSMALLLFQHTFLPISIWRSITCPEVGCFQSGIFSLRWLKQLFTFGVY